ncbi:MAG: Fis family transcriptional regulator, partial [Desulfosudaceae bacterium]
MTGIKDRIELFFEHFARTLYVHRVKTLLLMVLLIGAILYKLPALTVDTNTEALLRDTNPSKIIYNEFRDQFGQDRIIVIAITAENLFSEEFFLRLKDLHQDLEERVPYLDEVTSLINARNTRGEDDRLIVEDLLEGWPQERRVDFERLKKRVMANPAFINQIVSSDGHTTAVVVKPDVYQSKEADTLA